jgi:hypothetical protein
LKVTVGLTDEEKIVTIKNIYIFEQMRVLRLKIDELRLRKKNNHNWFSRGKNNNTGFFKLNNADLII